MQLGKDFKSWRQEETVFICSTETQNVFLGPATPASPGNLLDPTLDQLNLKLWEQGHAVYILCLPGNSDTCYILRATVLGNSKGCIYLNFSRAS